MNPILRIFAGLSDRYLGTNWLSNQAAEQDYQRTRELRQNDYDQQWKMFNAQNDYNTPSNQLSRFRDAGLNPNLMYGAPPALAANVTPNASGSFSSPRGANGAGDLISSIQQGAFMNAQKDLLVAQKENLDSQTNFNKSKTKYQDYMNKVEEQLAKSPIWEVTVENDGKSESIIEYGNARVEIARRTLDKLGISNSFDKATLNDLLYDIAVKVGVDYYGLSDFNTIAASGLPNYESEYAAMRGDRDVRIAAGKIQSVIAEATEAQKASQAEFNKWLEKNKDNDIVKFAMAIVGMLQTLGVTLPNFQYSNGPKGKTTKIGT